MKLILVGALFTMVVGCQPYSPGKALPNGCVQKDALYRYQNGQLVGVAHFMNLALPSCANIEDFQAAWAEFELLNERVPSIEGMRFQYVVEPTSGGYRHLLGDILYVHVYPATAPGWRSRLAAYQGPPFEEGFVVHFSLKQHKVVIAFFDGYSVSGDVSDVMLPALDEALSGRLLEYVVQGAAVVD